AGKTVTANANPYGVRFKSTVATDPSLTQRLSNVAMNDNTTAGLQFLAGSTLKVRNCELLRDLFGVNILPDGSVNAIGGLDLGTPSDFGHHLLQQEGGVGVCVRTHFDGSPLHAAGNVFETVDCSAPTPQFSLPSAGAQCRPSASAYYATGFVFDF